MLGVRRFSVAAAVVAGHRGGGLRRPCRVKTGAGARSLYQLGSSRRRHGHAGGRAGTAARQCIAGPEHRTAGGLTAPLSGLFKQLNGNTAATAKGQYSIAAGARKRPRGSHSAELETGQWWPMNAWGGQNREVPPPLVPGEKRRFYFLMSRSSPMSTTGKHPCGRLLKQSRVFAAHQQVAE